jgi:hypothetical protein
LSEEDKLIIDNIENVGCHILKVGEGEGKPGFAYSIGIGLTRKHPDLTIQGLNLDLAHAMINNYCDRLKDGETFESGKFYSGFLEEFDVYFVEVDKKYYEEYFGFATWLYQGKDYKMLQLIWPTTDGKWPWDEDTTALYDWAQPILNASGKLSQNTTTPNT